MLEILHRLLEGETVEFEGAKLRMIKGKSYGATLEPGDTYLAGRNSQVHLLTVKNVVDGKYAKEHGLKFSGWVESVENAYSFDFWDCIGVEIVEEE